METYAKNDFAWKLASRILEDFRPLISHQGFLDHADAAISGRHVHLLRKLELSGEVDSLTPYQLKLQMQVIHLFKKFQFTDDVFSSNELKETSVKKFMDNQSRLMTHTVDEDDTVKSVLSFARGWLINTMGDNLIHPSIVRKSAFGKKSSVGIPMRQACEGARYEGPLTGSDEHIDWHSKYYKAWNPLAVLYSERRARRHKVPCYRSVDILEAVLVPKTWKSLRMIVPNTTLGSLYSSGLGTHLVDILCDAGYDIRVLQEVHGRLAKEGSITGNIVTADQSLASDNITTTLVDRLFQSKWAQALNFGRISKLSVEGTAIDTPTFSTMGVGFTFPLQTLVFLSLLHGIKLHLELGSSTVISVFGDDMIYAKEMHETVMSVFPKLGLVINADKTFHEGYFRESCGSDYFHGVNVRPFHLGSVDGDTLGKPAAIEAFIYKTFNKLLARWSVDEVPGTVQFLLEELRKVRRSPFVVPPCYPDTAGLKLSLEAIDELSLPRPHRNIHGTHHFFYLRFAAKSRGETRHAPYLWARLRQPSVVIHLPGFLPEHNGSLLQEKVPIFTNVKVDFDLLSDGEQQFVTENCPRTRTISCISLNGDVGRHIRTPGTTAMWDRR